MKVSLQAVMIVAAIAILCLIAGAVGGAMTQHFGTSSYTLSYADFISVMLTAISLLLTILAIFLAILGVVGWNAISNGARQRTNDFLEEGFKEGNALHRLVQERVKEAMYEGIGTFDTNPKNAEIKNEGEQ